MDPISEQQLADWIASREIAILYFKTEACNVCTAQLPRLQSLADELELGLKVVDLTQNQHLSGSQMVFNVPVTKVFYRGREVLKEGAFLDFNRMKEVLVQLKEGDL